MEPNRPQKSTIGLCLEPRECIPHTHIVFIYGPFLYWHSARSRKVVGSIPDGVIWIFHWHNPSGRTVALGLTQPLTEMSTRNISLG